MEIHEWMVKPTYQTEWIQRRGIFLWLALYTGGLGGGLYLVSLYFNSLIGMIISFFIIALLKGGFHIAFLGKPWRFWRIVSRPQTSWLTRGFIFVFLFIGFAAIQIILTIFLPGTVWELVFKVLAGLMALGIATYTGFVLNKVKTISFWDSPLLPILFVMCGLLGGFGLIVLIGLFDNNINIAIAESGSRWLLIINALLVISYLWTAVNRDSTGKQSVVEQMRGKVAPVFWTGIVTLGIVIPLAVAAVSYFAGHASSGILVAGVACEIVGGLTLRYCILKVGIYKPLFPAPGYVKL